MNDRGRPLVSVQFVNFRTLDYLARALPSVIGDLEGSDIAYEIRVLENGSGDQLESVTAPYPQVSVEVSSRNLGFGAGHNRLAAGGRGRYLLILNPDIEFVAPRTTERLIGELEANPGAGVSGPGLIDPVGQRQRNDHGQLRGLRARLSLRAGHSLWRPAVSSGVAAWVSGAAMLVDRAAFESVGGFDERYFLYKEDEDLCLRLRRVGVATIYVPGVVIRHHGSVVADRGEELEQATRLFVATHVRDGRWRRVLERVHRALPYLRL